MNSSTSANGRLARRLSSPGLIVALFVLAMSACVVGLVAWKAVEARATALAQNETDMRNLAHSLAEHATHTVQAADLALSDIASFLTHNQPNPERLIAHLRSVVIRLPQLDDLAVLDAGGGIRFSSRGEAPAVSVANQSFFIQHRDNADQNLLISGPLNSRVSHQPVVVLSRRLQNANGDFAGIVVATIATGFFSDFYQTFQLGEQSSVTLLRADGRTLIRWPSMQYGDDMSKTELFQTKLPQRPNGSFTGISPFDGLSKHFVYEKLEQSPLVVTVARPTEEVLAAWNSDLRSDLGVALVLLWSVILLAVLLSAQLRYRARVEAALSERESQYRLLAANIADVVVVLDRDRICRYVSQSVSAILGYEPQQMIGVSCYEFVYPDDIVGVKLADAQLTDMSARTIVFRMHRADLSVIWIEANFKRAPSKDGDISDIVAVLRDVTRRREMEDQLNALNSRLAELATTDSLTGLANRRTLDVFLRREFAKTDRLAVLLIDIDHFKGFNDRHGHQAGDRCLKQVAEVLAAATAGTSGLSTRYGGEEFALILPGLSIEQATTIAESVRRRVRALGIANAASEHGYVTISIGISAKTPETVSETALLGAADQALYEAKRCGRNCCMTAAATAPLPSLVPLNCYDHAH